MSGAPLWLIISCAALTLAAASSLLAQKMTSEPGGPAPAASAAELRGLLGPVSGKIWLASAHSPAPAPLRLVIARQLSSAATASLGLQKAGAPYPGQREGNEAMASAPQNPDMVGARVSLSF